jgi:Nucleoside-diphosphate-sugar epimerases
MKILVTGAAGMVGRVLVPLLLEAGHEVVGTTQTAAGRERLDSLGIRAVLVDVLDASAFTDVAVSIEPHIIIHLVTDLASGSSRKSRNQKLVLNARTRRQGAANVAQAACACRAGRVIAQSIAWGYAPKELPPYVESDPLDIGAIGPRSISVCEGIAPLEHAILSPEAFDGLVLRYGQLYGPGTWSAVAAGPVPVHVDAAAHAALLSVHRGGRGAYNIADPGANVSSERACRELGWNPAYRRSGS